MHQGRILIGSPICQNPLILEAFFRSLRRLEGAGYELHYHFIDDNQDDLSRQILSSAKEEFKHITVERFENGPTAERYVNHNWSEEAIWKVAAYKDRLIRRAREEAFDWLFLVDSDLLLHTKTLRSLLNAQKDIVSEVFWTVWSKDAIPQPQVWVSDFYNQFEAAPGEKLDLQEEQIRTFLFYDKLRTPGVYEVGGLGACTLISARALTKGVSFGRIKNLTFWGEDRHFCIRASAIGLDLFVDTHYPACHVYRLSELDKGLTFLEETGASGYESLLDKINDDPIDNTV